MNALRSTRLVVLGVVVALALLVAAAFTQPAFSKTIVAKILGSATGTSVDIGSMAMHTGGATLTNVKISARGEQLAQIPKIDLKYNLHDLLPGSKHLYGLHALTIYNPRVTVVHNPDGTYNLPTLAKGGPKKAGGTPMSMTVRVVNGSLAVLDKTRVDPSARDVEVAGVNFNADVHTDARTVYRATMAYVDGRSSYPIRGGGVIDAPAGFTLHHWTAAHVPLPQLVNYALNNANIRMRAGYLDNLDARYYGNLSASAAMRGARITIAGVGAPVENVHGPLDVTSAGLTTSGLTATVAGAPVYVKGGIYDLKAPQFRLSVNTRSEIARLKLMSAAAAKLPLRGPVDLAMLVQGSVKAPLAMISLRSPQIDVRDMPLRDADASVAFDGKTANVLHMTVRYAGFSAAVRGRMALKNEPNAVEAFASVDGNSGDVPYAASMLPAMPLHASLLAHGESFKSIQTQGALTGSGGSNELAGAFALSGNGTGDVTLSLSKGGRAQSRPILTAKINIDHPHNRIAALVHANNFRIDAAHVAALPGLHVTGLPPVRATIDGDVFALRDGARLGLAGNAALHDASYGKMQIAQANAQFGGAPGAISISSLDANGSFGSLHARGTISGTNHIALQGYLRGSLSQLASVAGNLPAQGFVDAPIALVYDNGRAVAQVENANFTNASIRGVPIDTLSATVAQQNGTLNVYAARARIAHQGSAVATGAIGSSDSQVALSVANLPLSALHNAGVPLQSGVANVAATASGKLTAPNVNGAVVVDNARYGKYPVSAGSAFAYGGDTLTLHDALVGLGPAYVALDGSIGGVGMGAPVTPNYDIDATLRGADAGDLIALTSPSLQKEYIEGSIDANVHVGGAGRSPDVSGTFDAPEGSVHGLAFRNLSGSLSGTAGDLHVSGGHVTVGSTNVAFNAAVAGRNVAASVNAQHANLADFNDYFDQGDTLAGTGRLAIDVDRNGSAIASSGNVELDNVRYKRFAIGDTDAAWRTVGDTTTAHANIGGEAGRLTVAGTYSPRSVANVRASLRGLDLGTWLPLLGYRYPVTGHINADATARGRYPDVDLALNAAVIDGTVGRVQVQQAQVAMTAARGRGQVQHAIVRIPNLVAQGSGTFGFHANDPLALTMHATSPDVGKLMTTVTGKTYDAGGALDTTLAVNGTRNDPRLHDTFALTSMHYAKFTVPKMFGTISGDKRNVALENGEIDFKRGRIVASGHAPLHAPRNAPISANMRIDNVDFSDFESAFPEGYHLAGTMAGAMSVAGNVDNPLFNGSIALHNGYFVGPIDQNPISHLNGTIAFNANTIALQAVHANVGGGTMDVSGSARVPNFRRPNDATFNTRIVANGAQINSPKYFRGKIDANVTASRAAGGIPTIAGNVTIPSARIPLTAFWNPHAPKATPAPPIPLAFNLNAQVGNDVRVQSTGVDVGAQGRVAVGGTLASPTLNGRFRSTGGTITFLRRFVIQDARVRFDKANGIMPYIDATATTTVSNPETEIALHVTGLAPNNMQLAFDSSPGGYSREQILAMLTGVNNLNNPNAVGGGLTTFNAGTEIQNLAMGQLNTYFTQQLLEPLSASLGNALGLQNLQLTDDFTSGFGINAVKAFGKHVTAVFAENLGTPSRRSLTISAHHGESTAFSLMLYSVDSQSPLGMLANQNPFGYNNAINSSVMPPLLGTNGFTMMYEHKIQ